MDACDACRNEASALGDACPWLLLAFRCKTLSGWPAPSGSMCVQQTLSGWSAPSERGFFQRGGERLVQFCNMRLAKVQVWAWL